ncbi:hypothetical protein [Marinobacter zhanjiangensis]|uniref:Sporulation related domain-containing protein n=1 Tax=Marinobacter zhanjiangensis TaxID=578215 RepID=A0ABQ3B420_9GAMM|nr:hypothetical protein [Marinobacter zhanjiangensis]GGY77555.1 hypothetical protein GCM10007071_25950 [Marinobacter zhanjiangensis]
MRWFVLLLVAANVGLYFWFSANQPENVRSVDEGRLPRVAEIEMIGQRDSQPSPQVPEQPPVSEEDSGQEVVESEPVSEPPPKPAERPPQQCFGIGWFEEEAHAEAYRRQLAREEVDFRFRGLTQREEELEPFHWVIIPPLESRQAAMERYRELVDLGVEAYVVPSGERQHAISLGLFRSRRSAEDILRQRREQNINAILVKFPRNRISYALVFEGVSPGSFEGIGSTPSQSESGLQLIEFSDCEGVATTEKNP